MPKRSVASWGLGRRTKEATMTTKLVALVLLCFMTGTAMAQQPKVTSLMSKDLTENPGREVLMITVEHAPGGSSPIHRHNAHAIVYVLEGSVVMQVKGGKQVTLTPGQTFYEGPDDLHVVGRNASSTKPAKFLVFLISASSRSPTSSSTAWPSACMPGCRARRCSAPEESRRTAGRSCCTWRRARRRTRRAARRSSRISNAGAWPTRCSP